MKKALLRVLLLICGLNVFTSCYGMPPGDLDQPAPLQDEQTQPKVSDPATAEETDAETSEPEA